jgi:hypothetical protein
VVGSVFDTVGANFAQGSAYAFVRSGTVWTQQQQIVASDGAEVDEFGWAVAIDADTIVVGALIDSDAFDFQGSAYVFVRSGSSWSEQQKLAASDASINNLFGASVGISGNEVVVGANFAGTLSTGQAYVFNRLGTVWNEVQILKGNDAAFGDDFGRSVAISGDRIVVGASGADSGANQEQGAVYVYVRSGAFWLQEQKLLARGGAAGQFFGEPVAISGEVLISGFFNEVVPGPVRGSVRLYTRLCFDVCLQDDSSPGTSLSFNSTSGDYIFCCGGALFSGRGALIRKGSTVTLSDNASNRRLTATFSGGGINKGTAALQSPPGRSLCTIRDSNTANNQCSCGD